MCKDFLRLGCTVTCRVVSFYFDDTIDEGDLLWDRQDHLMSVKFGAVSDRRALVLETPARVMKGKKQMNPNWKYLPEWAYWKAPTTKDHKFSPHNHNWTAGVLYPEKDACWVGCGSCTIRCLTKSRRLTSTQTELDGVSCSAPEFSHKRNISFGIQMISIIRRFYVCTSRRWII